MLKISYPQYYFYHTRTKYESQAINNIYSNDIVINIKYIAQQINFFFCHCGCKSRNPGLVRKEMY